MWKQCKNDVKHNNTSNNVGTQICQEFFLACLYPGHYGMLPGGSIVKSQLHN